jgi:hypothetical protein
MNQQTYPRLQFRTALLPKAVWDQLNRRMDYYELGPLGPRRQPLMSPGHTQSKLVKASQTKKNYATIEQTCGVEPARKANAK